MTNINTNKELWGMITALRQRLGSDEEIAKRLGTSKSVVHGWRHGKNLSPTSYAKVMALFSEVVVPSGKRIEPNTDPVFQQPHWVTVNHLNVVKCRLVGTQALEAGDVIVVDEKIRNLMQLLPDTSFRVVVGVEDKPK